MHRSFFYSIFAICLIATTLPNVAPAQDFQSGNSPDPFVIYAVVWRGKTEVEQGFQEYLNQRGIPYKMIIRNLNLDRANAPPLVEEIKQLKPDLVYTWGTGTTLSIFGSIDNETPGQFVNDIPGLFVLVAYPQSARIIRDFKNTGRNLTGVSFLASIESQLNSILAYQEISKLAVIYDSTSSNSRINVNLLKEAVTKFNLELLVMPVPLNQDGKPDPTTLPDLVRKAKADGADMLYMGPDSFITRHGDSYTTAAIEADLPTFASTQGPLKGSKAMFGLVTDYHTLGKLAAVQAEKILVKEISPHNLPVAQLNRFKLWINIDIVREVMVYPPMDMISIADFKTSPGQ